VVATGIAAELAETVNLSIAPNVANSAVSAQVKSELTQADEATFDKPQILQPTADSRTIVSHTISGGESLDAIGALYGVSKDTVKWANNLTADTAEAGKVLQILPIDGVLYTVKSGDTIAAIAEKYKVDQTRIVLYNDLDVAGLTAGVKIILPGGVLPTEERPGYVAPRQYTATTYSYVNYSAGDVKYLYSVGYGAVSPGNTGTPGQCTWYAWDRRGKMGLRMPAGAVLGNASDWAYTLGRLGYSVNRGVPSVGAIMQNGGGAGHVAVVESIAENGDVTVSEMNYGYRAFVVTQRTISAGQAALYTFIQ
jgi:surface antigen